MPVFFKQSFALSDLKSTNRLGPGVPGLFPYFEQTNINTNPQPTNETIIIITTNH